MNHKQKHKDVESHIFSTADARLTALDFVTLSQACNRYISTLQVFKIHRVPSTMDDVYATELLRQDLINACERENRLLSKLQAAEEETEELRLSAVFHKRKYQELDDALEVEEAKTNAERLARQAAEEIVRQHRHEISKVKQRETIANEHCDAAESEFIQLQKDLSTERTAAEAARLLVCRLREDLEFTELNKEAAYDQLNAAQAKICTLQADFGVATGHISVLERQARAFEKSSWTEYQQMDEAERYDGALMDELNGAGLELRDLLKEYIDFKANHNEYDCAEPETATPLDAGKLSLGQQSDVDLEPEVSSSEYEREKTTGARNGTENKTVVRSAWSSAKDVVATGMPTRPEPAILRPAMASAIVCQLEGFKATGTMLTGPRANPICPLWKFYRRLPSKSLHLLFRGFGRR